MYYWPIFTLDIKNGFVRLRGLCKYHPTVILYFFVWKMLLAPQQDNHLPKDMFPTLVNIVTRVMWSLA